MTARTKRKSYNALQQLIQDHMDRTGETYADIAARAKCPRQTVSALMNRDDYQGVPHAVTLRRLAKGLQVSEATVREAAAKSISTGNGHTKGTPNTQVLADLVDGLPDPQVEVLIEAARVMRRYAGANSNGKTRR